MPQGAPHDAVAERNVLGAMLVHADAARAVAEILAPRDFYLARHQLIARAILHAHSDSGHTDPITVGAVLQQWNRLDEAGGHAELIALAAETVTAVGAEHHAEIVRERALRRELLTIANRVLAAAEDGADATTMRSLLSARIDGDEAHNSIAVQDWRSVASDPPVDWLVDGMLPRGGLAVLGGDPGAGKTLLALDLALRAAHGQDWLGRRVVAHSTLVLAGEGTGGLGTRLRAWRAAHPSARLVEGHYVAIARGVPNLVTPGGATELLRVIDDTRRANGRVPDVLVVDTLACATAGGDEDAAAFGAALSALGAAQRRHRCTPLVLHHPRKPSAERGSTRTLHELRGSGVLAGACDVVMLATRDGDSRTVHLVKARDGADGQKIAFQLNVVATGGVLADGRPEHSPVVLPAPVDSLAAPTEEDERQQLANAAAKRVEDVVATVTQMPGRCAPSARSIVTRTVGNDGLLYTAIKEAVAAGKLLPDGKGFRMPECFQQALPAAAAP